MIPKSSDSVEVPAFKRQVLLVDDDTDFAEGLADILDLQGYEPLIAGTPFEALALVDELHPNVAMIDIRLGNSSGIDLVGRIKEKHPDTLCIMVTAYAELETAISALQKGAYDYLRKPIEAHHLLTRLDHCFEHIRLQKEKEAAEQALKQRNLDLETANQRLRHESRRTAQALEQLRQSEFRYRYLFESAPVGLIKVDATQILTLSTGQGRAMRHDLIHALDRDSSLLNQIAEKIVVKEVNAEVLHIFEVADRQQFLQIISNYVATGGRRFVRNSVAGFSHGQSSVSGEITLQTQNRNRKYLLVRADLPPQSKDLGSILVSFSDITERKHAEAALEKEREKFKVLVDEAPFGVAILGPNGNFKYLNPKRIETFGFTLEDCPSVNEWMALVFPDLEYRRYAVGEFEHDLEEVLNTKQSISKTFNVTCKDGVIKTVHFRLMVLANDDQVVLSEDVSQQLRMEEQMAQAQKMEAVGTLAGGVAHDFNNLLQAIQGYSQLLLIDKPADDVETNKLKEIIKASERASELTKQLLTFSRKVESKLRPTNLNQVISQVNRLLNRTIPKMVLIELKLDEHLSIINADPIQMEQVMMNMAINARDAMPEGGRLTITTANVFLGEEFCSEHLGLIPGEYVALEVSDTGHGLDKDTIEHIFEPFFTTKGLGKGTGLGLSMVYGIVRNHRGHVECLSAPGEGATFKIYLPAMKKTYKCKEEVIEEDMPPGGNETILLVDDEKLLREIGTAILSRFGYQVLTCPDGECALELYQKKQSEISLIILDLIMPGMGGKRCLDELLSIDPGVRVVVSSGYSGDNAYSEDVEKSAKGFIKKPYDINQMLNVIRSILDEAS